jgi:hypothetical protein
MPSEKERLYCLLPSRPKSCTVTIYKLNTPFGPIFISPSRSVYRLVKHASYTALSLACLAISRVFFIAILHHFMKLTFQTCYFNYAFTPISLSGIRWTIKKEHKRRAGVLKPCPGRPKKLNARC